LDSIQHKGTIKKIDENSIWVEIIVQSACAGCHVKSVCTVADMKEKMIEVGKKGNETYNIGDEVTVSMASSKGTKALFLGYLLPFLILVFSLIILVEILNNEGLAGLLAISTLIPYYIILYFLRNRMKRTFEFRLV